MGEEELQRAMFEESMSGKRRDGSVPSLPANLILWERKARTGSSAERDSGASLNLLSKRSLTPFRTTIYCVVNWTICRH